MKRRELALPSQLVIPILRIFPTISTWNAGGGDQEGGGWMAIRGNEHRPQTTAHRTALFDKFVKETNEKARNGWTDR